MKLTIAITVKSQITFNSDSTLPTEWSLRTLKAILMNL